MSVKELEMRVAALEKTVSRLTNGPEIMERILSAAGEEFGIRRELIMGKARPGRTAEIRHAIFWIAAQILPNATDREIGKLLGRTRTAANLSRRRGEEIRQIDAIFKIRTDRIIEKLTM